jgi:hypothetical protein
LQKEKAQKKVDRAAKKLQKEHEKLQKEESRQRLLAAGADPGDIEREAPMAFLIRPHPSNPLRPKLVQFPLP